MQHCAQACPPTGKIMHVNRQLNYTVGNMNGTNVRVLSISGGTVQGLQTGENTNSVLVGSTLGAVGDIQLGSGSILTTAGEMGLGNAVGAYAGLTNSGGSITTATYIVVGNTNDLLASFTQNSGSTTLTTDVMTIGAGTGGLGVSNINGGTFTANGTTKGRNPGTIYVGEIGTVTLNFSGTASVNVGLKNVNGLILGKNSTSALGTLNAVGAELPTTRMIYPGASGAGFVKASRAEHSRPTPPRPLPPS